jgi:hypothetical protein
MLSLALTRISTLRETFTDSKGLRFQQTTLQTMVTLLEMD